MSFQPLKTSINLFTWLSSITGNLYCMWEAFSYLINLPLKQIKLQIWSTQFACCFDCHPKPNRLEGIAGISCIILTDFCMQHFHFAEYFPRFLGSQKGKYYLQLWFSSWSSWNKGLSKIDWFSSSRTYECQFFDETFTYQWIFFYL